MPDLLSSIAHLLELAHSRGEEAGQVLRDGSAIQRSICELHGVQRGRLGWGEAALRRDFELLCECVEEEICAGDETLAEPAQVLRRVLEQAGRLSVRAWRAAPPGPTG